MLHLINNERGIIFAVVLGFLTGMIIMSLLFPIIS